MKLFDCLCFGTKKPKTASNQSKHKNKTEISKAAARSMAGSVVPLMLPTDFVSDEPQEIEMSVLSRKPK